MRGESCHFQFREYEPAMIDQSIAYAKALGLKYMIMSSPKEGARNANVTMEQWKWNFDHMEVRPPKDPMMALKESYGYLQRLTV